MLDKTKWMVRSMVKLEHVQNMNRPLTGAQNMFSICPKDMVEYSNLGMLSLDKLDPELIYVCGPTQHKIENLHFFVYFPAQI